MQNSSFPHPDSLVEDVAQFGLRAINDYLSMSGDAQCWEIPERWPQCEIARQIWAKYKVYVWLELPIAKVLEWMSPDQKVPLVLQGERTSGRLDIGLFSSANRPCDANFGAVVELKRQLFSGSECAYDAARIYAMRELFPICAIVGGMFIGERDEIRKAMTSSLGISLPAISCQVNSERHCDGYSYGFVAAIV